MAAPGRESSFVGHDRGRRLEVPAFSSAAQPCSGRYRNFRAGVGATPSGLRRPGSSPPRHVGLRGSAGVPTRPGAGPRGVTTGGEMGVIRRRGDRQNPADRLDPMDGAMIIDERDHLLNGRSSSACAKYADAFLSISLACRSSRFSRSNALIRSRFARHSVPAPPSMSAWNRPAAQALPAAVRSRAIARIAATRAHDLPHSPAPSEQPARGSRRVPFASHVFFHRLHPYLALEPPVKPGRFAEVRLPALRVAVANGPLRTFGAQAIRSRRRFFRSYPPTHRSAT